MRFFFWGSRENLQLSFQRAMTAVCVSVLQACKYFESERAGRPVKLCWAASAVGSIRSIGWWCRLQRLRQVDLPSWGSQLALRLGFDSASTALFNDMGAGRRLAELAGCVNRRQAPKAQGRVSLFIVC